MIDQIFSLPTPVNMVVLIVLIGCGVGLLGTIATQIRRYGCHRQDIEFKRELVDRGLSAEEIERIVAAQAPERTESDKA
jgi:hypothetical protein